MEDCEECRKKSECGAEVRLARIYAAALVVAEECLASSDPRAFVRSIAETITAIVEKRVAPSPTLSKTYTLGASVRRAVYEEAIAAEGGNIRAAAKRLGVAYTTIWRVRKKDTVNGKGR